MNKYIAILILILSTLSFGTPAFADFQKGLDAYNSGDYATAMSEWEPLAEEGISAAQGNLGLMYQGINNRKCSPSITRKPRYLI